MPYRELLLAVACVLAAGCSINVRDDHVGDRESCQVRCADGSRAETSCAKPRIPACSCDPATTAACVKADGGHAYAL